MGLLQVEPADDASLRALAALREAARRHDDPDAFEVTARTITNDARYGYDLNPSVFSALEHDGRLVGLLECETPVHDNRHMLFGEVLVHPEHRRRGYGSVLMGALVDRAAELGRTTLWAHTPQDDQAGQRFLQRHGFARASADARRHQVLAEVDWRSVERLAAQAGAQAGDYELVRLRPPYSDELLLTLVEVTAAINDAPMGTLDYEPEVFDLDRLRDGQTAARLRGSLIYRVAARHRQSGEIGGHTFLVHDPRQPELGHQADTAVARTHRGHRLGVALKIEMMRWLAEAEPRLRVIETWNNVDNHFMIDVNEALGYRLSRIFVTYQRVLTSSR